MQADRIMTQKRPVCRTSSHRQPQLGYRKPVRDYESKFRSGNGKGTWWKIAIRIEFSLLSKLVSINLGVIYLVNRELIRTRCTQAVFKVIPCLCIGRVQ